jgi:SNF2 family DNA or RNA helicase
MKMMNLDDEEDEGNKSGKSKNAYDEMKFDAKVIRGPNQQITNRNISFEDSLKIVREEMFEVLESKPDRDGDYEAYKTANGMKVSLLPHQCYSMAWFKWRESHYPNGGILADDMGLGKTLTVLAYLNLVKEKAKEKLKVKVL